MLNTLKNKINRGTYEKQHIVYDVFIRLLLLPDHPTPIEVRTHTGEAVPYLLYDSAAEEKGPAVYNEKTAAETGIVWHDGYKLMGHLLQEEVC